jgi:hypothetical protein
MGTTLLVVAGVAVFAWLMRVFSRGGGEQTGGIPESAAPAVDEEADDLDDVGPARGEIAAITSDGWAFVPDGDAVQLIPPGDEDCEIPVRSPIATGYAPQVDPVTQLTSGTGAPVNPKTRKPVPGWKPGEHLTRGDLIAARVRRGAPNHDPWRLEALGRDHEYRAWRFETEDAARAALALMDGRIVRAPHGPDGDPVMIGDEDFAEAKRLEEETERELASEPPDDEGPGPDEVRR